MFRLAGHILIGYLCGMWLSDYIHADLSLTVWTNIWVYFWLLFWPLGLIYYFAYYFLAVILVFVLIGVVFAVSKELRDWCELWWRGFRHRRVLRRAGRINRVTDE